MHSSPKAQSEPKITDYGTGTVIAIGALGVLGYCVYRFKKAPNETAVHQTNETTVHQPKNHKFEME